MDSHHWVIFVRARFPQVIAAADRKFPVPGGPEIWRFCPSQVLGHEDMPLFASDAWGGMAVYDNRDAAEAFYEAPERRAPYLSEAAEIWLALAVCFAHHGTVRWRSPQTDETDTALRITRDAPAGRLAVVTSAGFNSRDPSQLPRMKRFARGVTDVMDYYAGFPGNLRRDVFNGGLVDGMDGITLSLWQDDKAMIGGAYKAGIHRSRMDDHEADSLFDRSSFSRFRILQSRGSWDGDPFAAPSD